MMISELVAGQHCMLYSVATLFLRWMQHLRCTNEAPFSPISSHTYIVVGNVDLLDVTHCGLWFQKLCERERQKKKVWWGYHENGFSWREQGGSRATEAGSQSRMS